MSDQEKYTPEGATDWHPEEEATEKLTEAEEALLETVQEYAIDIEKVIKDDIVRDNPERAGIIAERAGQAFMVRCELAENPDDVRAVKDAFTLGMREMKDARGVNAGVALADKLKEGDWDIARIEDALEGAFLYDLYGYAPARAITTLEKMGEGREIPAKDMMVFHLPEINSAVEIVAASEEMNAFSIQTGISKENYVGYLEDALKEHGIVKKESPDGIPYFEEEKTEGGDENV